MTECAWQVQRYHDLVEGITTAAGLLGGAQVAASADVLVLFEQEQQLQRRQQQQLRQCGVIALLVGGQDNPQSSVWAECEWPAGPVVNFPSSCALVFEETKVGNDFNRKVLRLLTHKQLALKLLESSGASGVWSARCLAIAERGA